MNGDVSCDDFFAAHLPKSAIEPLMSTTITMSFGPLEAATYLKNMGGLSCEGWNRGNTVFVRPYSFKS